MDKQTSDFSTIYGAKKIERVVGNKTVGGWYPTYNDAVLAVCGFTDFESIPFYATEQEALEKVKEFEPCLIKF